MIRSSVALSGPTLTQSMPMKSPEIFQGGPIWRSTLSQVIICPSFVPNVFHLVLRCNSPPVRPMNPCMTHKVQICQTHRNIPSMVSDMDDGEQSIDTPSYVCAKHAHTLTVWLLLMGCSDGVIWQRHEWNFDSFFITRVIYSFYNSAQTNTFCILHKMTIFTTSNVRMLPTNC